MPRYLRFNESTGRVLNSHSNPKVLDPVPSDYIESVDDDVNLVWIDNGVVTARPVSLCSIDTTDVIADGVDVITLSGAPVGAEIYSDEVLLGISDGTDVEINYDLIGNYPLKVVLFPYLDFKETINAT